jgi:hypothetical protein
MSLGRKAYQNRQGFEMFQLPVLQTAGAMLLQPAPMFGQSSALAGQGMVQREPMPNAKHTPDAHWSSQSQGSANCMSPFPMQLPEPPPPALPLLVPVLVPPPSAVMPPLPSPLVSSSPPQAAAVMTAKLIIKARIAVLDMEFRSLLLGPVVHKVPRKSPNGGGVTSL